MPKVDSSSSSAAESASLPQLTLKGRYRLPKTFLDAEKIVEDIMQNAPEPDDDSEAQSEYAEEIVRKTANFKSTHFNMLFKELTMKMIERQDGDRASRHLDEATKAFQEMITLQGTQVPPVDKVEELRQELESEAADSSSYDWQEACTKLCSTVAAERQRLSHLERAVESGLDKGLAFARAKAELKRSNEALRAQFETERDAAQKYASENEDLKKKLDQLEKHVAKRAQKPVGEEGDGDEDEEEEDNESDGDGDESEDDQSSDATSVSASSETAHTSAAGNSGTNRAKKRKASGGEDAASPQSRFDAMAIKRFGTADYSTLKGRQLEDFMHMKQCYQLDKTVEFQEAMRAEAKQPKLSTKIVTFFGDKDKDDENIKGNYKKFLAKLDAVNPNVGDTQKLALIVSGLRGYALNMFTALPADEQGNLQKLNAKFLELFKSKDPRQLRLNLFDKLRMRHDQKFDEFYYNQFIPKATDYKEELKEVWTDAQTKTRLHQRLPEWLRDAVELQYMDELEDDKVSLDQFVTRIRLLERRDRHKHVKDDKKKKEEKTSKVPLTDANGKKLSRSAMRRALKRQKVAGVKGKGGGSTGSAPQRPANTGEQKKNDWSTGPMNCYNCGGMGHKLAACALPRNEERISKNAQKARERREKGAKASTDYTPTRGGAANRGGRGGTFRGGRGGRGGAQRGRIAHVYTPAERASYHEFKAQRARDELNARGDTINAFQHRAPKEEVKHDTLAHLDSTGGRLPQSAFRNFGCGSLQDREDPEEGFVAKIAAQHDTTGTDSSYTTTDEVASLMHKMLQADPDDRDSAYERLLNIFSCHENDRRGAKDKLVWRNKREYPIAFAKRLASNPLEVIDLITKAQNTLALNDTKFAKLRDDLHMPDCHSAYTESPRHPVWVGNTLWLDSILDSGACVNAISMTALASLCALDPEHSRALMMINRDDKRDLYGVGSNSVTVYGSIKLQLSTWNASKMEKFYVYDDPKSNIIIGVPGMRALGYELKSREFRQPREEHGEETGDHRDVDMLRNPQKRYQAQFSATMAKLCHQQALASNEERYYHSRLRRQPGDQTDAERRGPRCHSSIKTIAAGEDFNADRYLIACDKLLAIELPRKGLRATNAALGEPPAKKQKQDFQSALAVEATSSSRQ